jgi:uncharacterized membrane protein
MNRWFALGWVLAAVCLGASLYVWHFEYERLPERLPVHWDIRFEPDQFVERAEALTYFLIPPLAMAGFLLLAHVLPWLSPRHFKVDSFRRVYDYVIALVVALFAYLHVMLLWSYIAGGAAPGRLIVAGFFLFFALIGNVMGQVQRNFWVGVRTPWTLASEAVWIRTHRVAAWLYVPLGILGFVAVLAGAPLAVCFVVFLVVALLPVFYSLALYKRLERQGKV